MTQHAVADRPRASQKHEKKQHERFKRSAQVRQPAKRGQALANRRKSGLRRSRPGRSGRFCHARPSMRSRPTIHAYWRAS